MSRFDSPPDLEVRLRDALDAITVNCFAGGHDIGRVQDPRIVVEDVGRIGLPLSEEQARRIISKAYRAPSHEDGSSITYTAARNAWELNPRNFTVTADHQWDILMSNLLRVVSDELGVKLPIKTYLRKMLLYEKGATFKGHGDPGNNPNVFGTLVINLPSCYTGGDVVVRHVDEEKVLSTSKFKMGCAFWYTNASYEILLVESGYRWVLIYSLATEFPLQKAPSNVSKTGNKALRGTLKSCLRDRRVADTAPTYYAFEHRYAPGNFSLAHLKSRDQACVEQLLNAGRGLGFEIFLATLERENSGDPLEEDDDYGYEYYRHRNYYGLEEGDEESDDEDRHADGMDSTLRATAVYDLSGNEILSSIAIDEYDLLQGEDAFENPPDEEDYDGDTVLTWSRQQLDKSAISFERLAIGFSRLVETQKSLDFQYQAILALHGDIDPNEELLELLRNAASKAVNHLEASCSYEDGLALFDLTLYLHDNLELLKSSIIPELMKSSSHLTAFMLGFIHRWRQSMQRKQISLNEAKPIYEDLVRLSIQNLSVSKMSHVEYVRQRYENQDFAQLMTPTPLVTYPMFRPFVLSLFQPGLEEQRKMFIEKISAEAKFIPPDRFEDLWIPLLQDLLFACQKLKISLSSPSWQRLYQEVLGCLLLRYVGKQPPNGNPVEKRVSCPCATCRRLNNFLTNPTEMVARFRLTFTEMNHIQYKLSVFGIDCTVEQDTHGAILFKKSRQAREQERLWEKRKLEAAKQLYAFDQQKLRTILADKYEAIMMMSVLECPKDTASFTWPSVQRREAQAPGYKSLAEEMARLEAEMNDLVKTTPSSAPTPATTNAIAHRPPTTSAAQARTAYWPTAAFPSRPFVPSHTPLSGASRVGLPTKNYTTRKAGIVYSYFEEEALHSIRPSNRPAASYNTAPSRPVIPPSRPPPSMMAPQPVTGAKRKRVEYIDLTLDDD
ncbi:hypothetical protein O1611_g7352 [Lasiodiplodia mahajangana]|uniref:Uncharacterized protein n=1 Tax=Lasiodiplodia mahajangana TaxID=1108764 RepID=A0ACC2JFU1_9PEZI|nr:hypothetical protein O1611_g7352 [Lasiodiplodia mahajangana]